MEDYIGIFSSDWSQCLSPNGPFDALVFHHPHLDAELLYIFKRYTANEISLNHAIDGVTRLLQEPLTLDQMDAYLKAKFEVYPGVADLILWCQNHRILFMVNTTGFMGYFQRCLAKALLPPFPALSAQSMICFPNGARDPDHILVLCETKDKASNTAVMAQRYRIDAHRIILMGDSGGDGPHFEWGANTGATLIGSMTKPSLRDYCRMKGIKIHYHVGHSYGVQEEVSFEKEQGFNFLALSDIVQRVMDLE